MKSRLPPGFFKAYSPSPNLLTQSPHVMPGSATSWNILTVSHLFQSLPLLHATFLILPSLRKNNFKPAWTLLRSWLRTWGQRRPPLHGITAPAAKGSAFNRRGGNWRLCPKTFSMVSSRDPRAPSALVEIAGHLWILFTLAPPPARKVIRTPSCHAVGTLADSWLPSSLVVGEHRRPPNPATVQAAGIRSLRFVRCQVPQT